MTWDSELLILKAAFVAYICACLVAVSSIFYPLREYIKTKLPWLRIGSHPHFIECRLCLSLYTSIAGCFILEIPIQFDNILIVYGLAYFLATQER